MIQRPIRTALVLSCVLAVPLAAAQSAMDTPDAQSLYHVKP